MSRARSAKRRFAGTPPLHMRAIEQPLLTLLVIRDAGANQNNVLRNTHSITLGVREAVDPSARARDRVRRTFVKQGTH